MDKKYTITFVFSLSVIVFVIYAGSYVEKEGSGVAASVNTKTDLSWREDERSLSLMNGEEVIWRLNYDKSEDKPYFYPLRTLSGIDLALQRPADHPWHRGLWFSWKTINELNYWEEDPETGLAPGRTIIENVETKLGEDYSADVEFQIAYGPNKDQTLILEKRKVTISSPDSEGNYHIDWSLHFAAQENNIFLDRVVPLKHGGVSWGGYAGLGFRADDLELDSIRYIDSNGWSRSESLTGYGKGANWMDMTGVAKTSDGKAVGLAIFDHPSNPRHPSPWYIWYQKGEHAFFMPAFLYDKPYKLPAGESFTLRYRVLVHEGEGSLDELSAEYQSYVR